jgi:hypothetical protein
VISCRRPVSVVVKRIMDIFVSALGHGCGQLQMISLRVVTASQTSVNQHGVMDAVGCRRPVSVVVKRLIDIGVSALGHGCGQLQMISLRGCDGIRDIGVSALVN